MSIGHTTHHGGSRRGAVDTALRRPARVEAISGLALGAEGASVASDQPSEPGDASFGAA
jgi:hypothetical protein